MMGIVGNDRRPRDRDHHGRSNRRDQRMNQRSELGDEKATRGGAYQAAEAPECMADDMIARRMDFSTATALAFIDTSIAAIVPPK